MSSGKWTGAVSLVWEVDGNWDGATFPQGINESATIDSTADAIITSGALTIGKLNSSGSFTGSLTLGGNLTVDDAGDKDGAITFLTGSFDANGHDVDTDENCTITGDTLSMGTGSTWTVAGDWDDNAIDTFNIDTGLLILTGSGKIYSSAANKLKFHLQIASGASITDAGAGTKNAQRFTVDGTYTLGAGRIFGLISVSLTVSSTGQITGGGLLKIGAATATSITNDGTIDVATFEVERKSTVTGSGTFASATNTKFSSVSGAGANTQLLSDLLFTGPVQVESDVGGGYNWNNSGNHNVEFRGNLDLIETSGTLVWTKGTGSITLGGTSGSQTITSLGKDLDNIIINHSGTLKTFADTIKTDKVTATAGDFTFGSITDVADLAGAPAAALTIKFSETAAHVIDVISLVGAGSTAMVSLRSEVDANQYDITATTDAIVRFLDIKDMNLSGADWRNDRGKDSGNNSANVKRRQRIFVA